MIHGSEVMEALGESELKLNPNYTWRFLDVEISLEKKRLSSETGDKSGSSTLTQQQTALNIFILQIRKAYCVFSGQFEGFSLIFLTSTWNNIFNVTIKNQKSDSQNAHEP